MHRLAAVVLLLWLWPVVVFAQDPEPAPLPREPKAPFVVDARLGWPGLSKDADVATSLGVTTEDLPGRGFGLIIGAQFYAARTRTVSLGIGGEMLWARAGRTKTSETTGRPEGPPLKNRWSNISPQMSLNFGSKDGWSYLTGGLGWSKVTMEREDEPQESGSRVRTLNYGGGAKWFTKKHLAFNLDLRFYSIGAQEAIPGRLATPGQIATPGRIAIPNMRVLVFSGGISLR